MNEELNCHICEGFMFTLKNLLVECSKCRALYHQKCHSPIIDSVSLKSSSWICRECEEFIQPYETPSSTTSISSASSASSSPVHPLTEVYNKIVFLSPFHLTPVKEYHSRILEFSIPEFF